jgi:anti-anti-sigma factor
MIEHHVTLDGNDSDSKNLTCVVVSLRGEFDLAQAERLHDAFGSVLDDSLVVLDLEHVAYLDSTVLGSIIRLQKNLVARGGVLEIAAPTDAARRLFVVTSLTKMLSLRNTVAEALGGRAARRLEVVAEA